MLNLRLVKLLVAQHLSDAHPQVARFRELIFEILDKLFFKLELPGLLQALLEQLHRLRLRGFDLFDLFEDIQALLELFHLREGELVVALDFCLELSAHRLVEPFGF